MILFLNKDNKVVLINSQPQKDRKTNHTYSGCDEVTLSEIGTELSFELKNQRSNSTGEKDDYLDNIKEKCIYLWEKIREEALGHIRKAGIKKALSIAIGKVFSGAVVGVLSPDNLLEGEEELLKEHLENQCNECGCCIQGDGYPSGCPCGVFLTEAYLGIS